MTYKRLVYSLFFILVIFHILDIVLTYKGINLYGFDSEANEFVKFLFIKGISYLWIILKLFLFTILFVMIRLLFNTKEKYKHNIFYDISKVMLPLGLSLLVIDIFLTCLNWINNLTPLIYK